MEHNYIHNCLRNAKRTKLCCSEMPEANNPPQEVVTHETESLKMYVI
jgi:hypothetical protein